MTKRELINKINELSDSIDDLKGHHVTLESLLEDTLYTEKNEFEESIARLNHCLESFQLSAAGNICPKCNGSGRV